MKNELKRCHWVENSIALYQQYHDEEWGVPVRNDHKLIEMLILESFHTGLSWLIILKKREAFRLAFDDYDLDKIMAYDDRKVSELLSNAAIVRNKLKILATIGNAKAIRCIQSAYGSFAAYLWSFTDQQVVNMVNQPPVTSNALSDRIAKDFKKKGIGFMGTTTVFAYLQAVGILNCHDANCFRAGVSD
ncbi:MAG: DNA-3-methyladenine glycosylase I [Erysipelotrichaceae bacterium]|nr:DNA-3-methyladenine glycosylase I [Erysipelotrichaceae bacterium]